MSQAAGTSGGRYPGTTRTGSGAAVTNNHMRLQKQMLKDRRLAKRVKQIHDKLVSVQKGWAIDIGSRSEISSSPLVWE